MDTFTHTHTYIHILCWIEYFKTIHPRGALLEWWNKDFRNPFLHILWQQWEKLLVNLFRTPEIKGLQQSKEFLLRNNDWTSVKSENLVAFLSFPNPKLYGILKNQKPHNYGSLKISWLATIGMEKAESFEAIQKTYP